MRTYEIVGTETVVWSYRVRAESSAEALLAVRGNSVEPHDRRGDGIRYEIVRIVAGEQRKAPADMLICHKCHYFNLTGGLCDGCGYPLA